jgi:hypothetical protein
MSSGILQILSIFSQQPIDAHLIAGLFSTYQDVILLPVVTIVRGEDRLPQVQALQPLAPVE